MALTMVTLGDSFEMNVCTNKGWHPNYPQAHHEIYHKKKTALSHTSEGLPVAIAVLPEHPYRAGYSLAPHSQAILKGCVDVLAPAVLVLLVALPAAPGAPYRSHPTGECPGACSPPETAPSCRTNPFSALLFQVIAKSSL